MRKNFSFQIGFLMRGSCPFFTTQEVRKNELMERTGVIEDEATETPVRKGYAWLCSLTTLVFHV